MPDRTDQSSRSAWIESLAQALQTSAAFAVSTFPDVTSQVVRPPDSSGPPGILEELTARHLLAQAALRCAVRQGGGLSPRACDELVRLLRVGTDRARAREDMLEAWCTLGRAFGQKDRRTAARTKGLWSERIRLAVRMVERNHAEAACGARSVARHLGVSPRTLLREFRTVTGGSFAAFVRDARMQTARELLQQPALSIKEVAARTGYTHHANFTRAFTAHVGVSPVSFREACLHSLQHPDADGAPPGSSPRGWGSHRGL